MRKILIYISFIILIVTQFSCTERITIELDTGKTKLVVYGEITTDTTSHSIFLHKTAPYLNDSEPIAVNGAIVELAFLDTSFLLTENMPGVYQTPSDFYGVEGVEYHLSLSEIDINQDGETESYLADAYMPFVPTLDSIRLKYTSNSFYSGWEIMVYAWDPAGIKNFYIFKAYKNGKLLTDTLTEYIVQNDDFFDGNFTYGITSQFIDDNKEDEMAIPGDTVTFEMDAINEGFFWFLVEAQTESFGSIPLFSGPRANIKSNISNGALGYFTAYSYDSKTVIVPGYPPED